MHKSSSRRNDRREDRHTTSLSSHPATGFYSTDGTYSETMSSCSFHFKSTIGKTTSADTDEDYDSMAEYEVEFPVVELKMPQHRHHHHHHHKEDDRSGVYEELSSENPSYIQTSCPRSSSSHTYQSSFNSQQRFQSLGNIFSSIFSFFQNNPNMTKIILGIVLCYVMVCNLEIIIPKLISMIVRFFYPWVRYCAIVAEQFFSTIANMFTRMDAVIYASYCEFAAKYCRSRRLMCDVTCSFVDHVLSQSRPHLAPIPQN